MMLSESYMGVWGTGPDDVYITGNKDGFPVAGHATQIMAGVPTPVELGVGHWDGSSWSDVTASTQLHISHLWGSGANDIFGVGAGGAISHWDGTAWSSMTSGVTADLNAIWGTGSGDVLAVGNGVTVRWNGATWSATLVTPSLSGIWMGAGAGFSGGKRQPS